MVARAAPILNNQPVVEVNKAGAGTVAASKYVLGGKKDGCTFYNTSTSSITVPPRCKRPISHGGIQSDWAKSFPRGTLSSSGRIPPYTNMGQFIESAKQNPVKIKYATAGAGESSHLSMEGCHVGPHEDPGEFKCLA
jgi:tripartite-type tricarboxylate transporter receptor subunit TctC